MNVYLAGPMRGIRNFNVDTFDRVADVFRAEGYLVLNPCDKDRDTHGPGVFVSETGDLADIAHLNFNLRETLAWDLNWIASSADGIVMLPGFQKSKGATAELALAEALGLTVFYVDDDGNMRDDPRWVQAMTDLGAGVSDAIDRLTGEVRSVSSTGGEKGVKLARFDLIPTLPLEELAKHYGRGAAKYDDHNWARGYEWSKSYAAMQRHANAFWSGTDIDEETGSPHIVAVAWHAFTLIEFFMRSEYHQFDDRREQR